jgi:hypothetical protein
MALWTVAAEPSAWEFGWEALVALGTLALAVATAALTLATRSLARKTSEEVQHAGALVKESQEQVKATQNQARISQLTLNAQIRPVLIDLPLDLAVEEPIFFPDRDEPVMSHRGAVHVGAGGGGVMISLPLRNAGVGLAMIRGVALRMRGNVPTPPVMIRPANVPPHQRGRVSFWARADDPAFPSLREAVDAEQDFSVEVAYSDLAGQELTISRFDVYLRKRGQRHWEVRQVHLQEPDADEPFAGSAPTA